MPYKSKEKANECKKQWRLNNPTKVKAADIKKRQINPQQRLLHSSKWNAKSRNLEHTITKEDIIIPEHCPYLGIKLTNICGKGRHNSNPSIDRIDNNKGYISKNIRVISDKANKLKSNLSEKELIFFAKNILKLHGHN